MMAFLDNMHILRDCGYKSVIVVCQCNDSIFSTLIEQLKL